MTHTHAPQLLRNRVQEAFLEGGILSQATQQFQPRTGQTDMALAVADVISDGGSLVALCSRGQPS